jgi:hypothetical protein
MTDLPQEDTLYMGTCSTSAATAPIDHTVYTWCKIRGKDGIDGDPGDDGRTQYLHIKYSDDGKTFTSNNGETLGAYIGTLVDFVETDSTVFSDYTWKKFTEDVDEDLKEIRQSVITAKTEAISESEKIILSALKEYVETGDFDSYKETVSSQLRVMAEGIDMDFMQTTERITNVDGDLQSKFMELYKYIKFNVNGITIGDKSSGLALTLDNDMIVFSKNGVAFGRWDGTDFYTGNIVVETHERAQFGNFAFVPREDDSLSLLHVDELGKTDSTTGGQGSGGQGSGGQGSGGSVDLTGYATEQFVRDYVETYINEAILGGEW